jgi:hypothetical protein
MDNRTFAKIELPSWYVTERTSCARLPAYLHEMEFFGGHIYPRRLSQAGVTAGSAAIEGTVNENLSKVVSNEDHHLQIGDAATAKRKKDWKLRKTKSGSRALWKYAEIDNASRSGALSRSGPSNETRVHADV